MCFGGRRRSGSEAGHYTDAMPRKPMITIPIWRYLLIIVGTVSAFVGACSMLVSITYTRQKQTPSGLDGTGIIVSNGGLLISHAHRDPPITDPPFQYRRDKYFALYGPRFEIIWNPGFEFLNWSGRGYTSGGGMYPSSPGSPHKPFSRPSKKIRWGAHTHNTHREPWGILLAVFGVGAFIPLVSIVPYMRDGECACGYSLAGLKASKCPECGRIF